jgi:uncharacterized protein (DUF1015 family)
MPDLEACLTHMAAQAPTRHAFGLYAAGRFHALLLDDTRLLSRLTPDNGPPDWEPLDVSIAHTLLLGHLGLSEADDDREPYLRYHRDPRAAVEAIDRGDGDLLLLLNPTRIEQVKAYAGKGIKMPSKSTDFYPKMIAGLTMMPVGPGDEIAATV